MKNILSEYMSTIIILLFVSVGLISGLIFLLRYIILVF